MKGSALGVICLSMFAGTAMAVGDKETEALLARMRSVYSGVKTVSIEVETRQIVQDQPSTLLPRKAGPGGRLPPPRKPDTKSTTTVIKSELLYKAPFSISLKCSVNGFSTLRVICDGLKLAEIRKDGNVNVQAPIFQSFDSMVPLNLESMCFYDWKRQLSTDQGMNMATSTFRILKAVPWNGKKWTVLEETAAGQRVTCLYYIDPSTALIWRTTTTDFGSKQPRQDCRVISLKLNVKHPPGSFRVPRSQYIRI